LKNRSNNCTPERRATVQSSPLSAVWVIGLNVMSWLAGQVGLAGAIILLLLAVSVLFKGLPKSFPLASHHAILDTSL